MLGLDAALATDDVNVVYASANATALDATEARAIASVFGGAGPGITSIKGAIGHCMGAAGALESVIAIYSLA